MSVEIYRLFWSKVTVFDIFLIMWLTSDNIEHVIIHAQEEIKFHFYTIYGILCVMLDLHVLKIIAYFIKHFVFFLYPSSFLIDSFQETSILEGVIVEIFSCLFDTFPVRASYFLLM